MGEVRRRRGTNPSVRQGKSLRRALQRGPAGSYGAWQGRGGVEGTGEAQVGVGEPRFLGDGAETVPSRRESPVKGEG